MYEQKEYITEFPEEENNERELSEMVVPRLGKQNLLLDFYALTKEQIEYAIDHGDSISDIIHYYSEDPLKISAYELVAALEHTNPGLTRYFLCDPKHAGKIFFLVPSRIGDDLRENLVAFHLEEPDEEPEEIEEPVRRRPLQMER